MWFAVLRLARGRHSLTFVRWSFLRQFREHFGWDAVWPRTASKTARSRPPHPGRDIAENSGHRTLYHNVLRPQQCGKRRNRCRQNSYSLVFNRLLSSSCKVHPLARPVRVVGRVVTELAYRLASAAVLVIPTCDHRARSMSDCENTVTPAWSLTHNGPPISILDALRADWPLTKQSDAKVCSRLPYASDDEDRLNSLPNAHTHQPYADTTKCSP
jgi:hypothetical protein